MPEAIDDRIETATNEANRLIRISLGLPENVESDIKVFTNGLHFNLVYEGQKKPQPVYSSG